MPRPETASNSGGDSRAPQRRVYKRLVGSPCVVKTVLKDKGFGFASQIEVAGGKDIYFHLDRVVCDGGLPVEKGDRVKCWVSEVEDDRPKATRVEVERFVVGMHRRVPILKIMDVWLHTFKESEGASAVSAEERRSARLHATSCLAMWRAAAEILGHAMHPQWGALRAGVIDDPMAAAGAGGAALELTELSNGARQKKGGIFDIATTILDEGKDRRSMLPSSKKQMHVGDVRFTHDWISSEFRNGGSLEQLVADLRRGRLLPAEDDRLRLCLLQYKGHYCSVNNRRLWALKTYQGEIQKTCGHDVKVEVGVSVYSFCHGTAAFMRDMLAAEKRCGEHSVPARHALAEATLTSILQQHQGTRPWVLEDKADLIPNFAVDDIAVVGEARLQGRRQVHQVAEGKFNHSPASALAKQALAGNHVVDMVKYKGQHYSVQLELGLALKQAQVANPSKRLEFSARIIPLCPLTAKFLCANSTQVSGQSVVVRNSLPDGGDWPLPRIVSLLLQLASELSSTPKAPQIFKILSSSSLFGEQSALARAVQLGNRASLAQAFWPFVQRLAVCLPQRLGQALPSLRLFCESLTSDHRAAALVDMLSLLSSACSALAVDDGGLGGTQPWQMLPMVPLRQELRSMSILPTGRVRRSSQALPIVHTRGRYESPHQYLDTYFRLLREDCTYAIRASLADIRDRGQKAENAMRDGNSFRAQLVGCTVGRTADGSVDSRMKVVLKVQPMFPKQRWRFGAARFLMYGNLVSCIVDEDFDRPVWAMVARRDLENSMVAVDLYTGSLAGAAAGHGLAEALFKLEAAKTLVLVASPTYFRAYEPVLRTLQSKSCEDLPFQDELVHCKVLQSSSPAEIHGGMEVDQSLVFNHTPHEDHEFQVVGISALAAEHSKHISRESSTIANSFSIKQLNVAPTPIFEVANVHWHQIAIASKNNVVRHLLAPGSSYSQIHVDDEIIVKTGLSNECRYCICRVQNVIQGLLECLDTASSDPAGSLASSTTLDPSQVAALKHALTCRVSLIQGPPGTGKTFLGFKILQLLMMSSRILVLTYKNHALDEFLQHCIKGGHPKSIVRVGGRGSADCQELESRNLRALKRSLMSKEGWEAAIGADAKLQELRTHHMHARTAAAAAQAQVDATLRQYSARHEHSTDAFLASVTYMQLKVFLEHTNWYDKAWQKRVKQWIDDAAWWLEDGLDQLPQVLSSGSKWLDDVLDGWGYLAKEWRDGLQSSVAFAISTWLPSKAVFDEVRQGLLAEVQASAEHENLDHTFAWQETDENIEIKTQEELVALASRLSASFQVMDDLWLRPGCCVRRGKMLLAGSGALRGRRLPGHPTDLIGLLRLPATLVFDEDDEAVRELQAEIEAERLASRGGEAMSVEETRGLVQVGAMRRARRGKEAWVPTFHPALSDQLGDAVTKRLLATPNLHSLGGADRAKLVHVQIASHKSTCDAHLKDELSQLAEACDQEEEMDKAISVEVLRRAKIIGMTVTGASIYAELVREVQPDVVLVEEAAEVLEPQILAVLGPWVKHLVMIGDHLQLPPPVETYALKRDHHFDTSMMERLILNRLPHVSLLRQSRMLPSLSKLLLPIYPQLQDNLAVVRERLVPACVRSEVFWWDCQHLESESERSRTNKAECERVLQLALFFIAQGYRPPQITVLSSYQGQIAEIRKQIRERLPAYLREVGQKRELEPVHVRLDPSMVGRGNRVEIATSDCGSHSDHRRPRVEPSSPSTAIQPGQYVVVESPPGTKIDGDLQVQSGEERSKIPVKLEPMGLQQEEMIESHTIDRYQGDENDIVIISLVRSNKERKLGFLGTDDGRNRMCVAQSRARCGLYFVGNVDLLRTAPHWATFIGLLEERGCVGQKFPQRCPRHPDVVRDAQEASEICTGTAAVCGRVCNQPFGCGAPEHICKRPCHAEGGHSADRCKYLVTKAFACKETPQHTFPRLLCSRRTDREPCPFAETICCPRHISHRLARRCGETLEAVHSSCHHPCTATLACGHPCPNSCSQGCLDPSKCTAPKDFACPRFPEHPKLRGQCNASPQQVAAACGAACKSKLACGHLCQKRCSEPCTASQQCAQTCNRQLPCGHHCTLRCNEECRCVKPKVIVCAKNAAHTITGQCCEDRAAITRRCALICEEKLPCGHTCPYQCSQCNGMHDGSRLCNQKCSKALSCGHLCTNKCSEVCIKREDCIACKKSSMDPDVSTAINLAVSILTRSDGGVLGSTLSSTLQKHLPSDVRGRIAGQKGWLKKLIQQSDLIEVDPRSAGGDPRYVLAAKLQAKSKTTKSQAGKKPYKGKNAQWLPARQSPHGAQLG